MKERLRQRSPVNGGLPVYILASCWSAPDSVHCLLAGTNKMFALAGAVGLIKQPAANLAAAQRSGSARPDQKLQ